ncbi:MAG TPA: Xaa-Pro dipeptidase [Myxococcota bacterium]
MSTTDASLADRYAEHVKTLVERTAAVASKHGLDGIVVHSGSLQSKTPFDDQDWPLVIVPTFRHWLPLAVANCALLVRTGHKPTLFLNVERSYWDGPAEPESDHFWSSFDVVEVTSPGAIREALRSSIGGLAYIGSDRGFGAALGFADDRLAPAALIKDLDGTRVHKTAYEVDGHRDANRRAARGHLALANAFAAGDDSELDLHLLYLRTTEQDDSDAPYKGIIAIDEHAATLHHVAYGRRRGPGRTLLVDAGAQRFGYQSDITRTYCKASGDAADTFRALIAAIDKLQHEIVASVKVGDPYQGLHDNSHRLLAEALLSTGIARNSSAEALVAAGTTRKLFPHGLGHSLGVITHDVGMRLTAPKTENPYLRNTSTIEAGQVFTVEPGCYFIPALLDEARALPDGGGLHWPLVEALVPFGGIRIEDNIHVTPTGPDNLTRPFLPR